MPAHGEAGWTGRLVPLTVDGPDLCEFDGDARLGAPEGAGARPGQPRPRKPCTLAGYPQVTLYDANGRVLPFRSADGGGADVTTARAFGYAR